MAPLPHIQLRQTGYYYRHRVPNALRCIFGQREIVRSLKTTSLQVAKRRAAMLMAEVYGVFAHIRSMNGDLTHNEAQQIADSWKRTVLNEDFERRLSGQTHSLSASDYDHQAKATLQRIKRSDLAPPDEALNFIQSRLDRPPLAGSQDERRLNYYILKAQVELLRELKRRACPETPHLWEYEHASDPLPAAPRGSSMRLSNALAAWEKAKPRPEATIREWQTAIRRFIDLKNDLSINAITKRDVIDFKRHCEQLPRNRTKRELSLSSKELVAKYRNKDIKRISPKTVKKQLSAIRSVFSWCVQENLLDENPASGVTVDVPKSVTKARLPFSFDDLKAIFEHSPIYRDGWRTKACAGDAGYWIPLIALFSGMRLEEIGQLQIGDVRDAAGIWYFDINALDGDKTLKTASSERRVPIHAKLMELDFLDYARKIRRHRHKWLFPHLDSSKRKRTESFSKWINRYLSDTCRIPDQRKVFHSFRHNFKDACREAEIPTDIQNALMGHSTHTVPASYGNGFSNRILNNWVQLINFPELRISTMRHNS